MFRHFRSDRESQKRHEQEQVDAWVRDAAELLPLDPPAVSHIAAQWDHLSREQARALIAAHERVPVSVRLDAARSVSRLRRRLQLEERVQSAYGACVESDATDGWGLSAEDARTAAEIQMDVLTAVALWDRLDAVDLAALYCPWAEVVDLPETPEQAAEIDAEEAVIASGADVLGPNGGHLVRMMNQLAALGPEDADDLVAKWVAINPDDRRHALQTVDAFAAGEPEAGYMEAALRSVDDWVAPPFDPLLAVKGVLRSTARSDEWEGLLELAADAARDAFRAATLEHELDASDYNALYAPWSEVVDARHIGEPG